MELINDLTAINARLELLVVKIQMIIASSTNQIQKCTCLTMFYVELSRGGLSNAFP